MKDEARPNPWVDSGGSRGEKYDERFDQLAARGLNVHGEAEFVASLGAGLVLDAGCGTGRVAIELARRGLEVVGIDLDPMMLGVAKEKAPQIWWVEADLAAADLGRCFDAVVMAGNVMIFVASGSEGAVLANLARHLNDAGVLVAGFSLVPGGLDLETYDRLADRADLELVERWGTWDREPFDEGRDYAVSVHRKRRPEA